MPYFTSCEWMADRGDPLATEKDWIREQQIAANPRANTRERRSALDYIEVRKPLRRRTYVGAPRAYPKPSELTLAMRRERENLKEMLCGLCESKPEPVIRVHEAGNVPVRRFMTFTEPQVQDQAQSREDFAKWVQSERRKIRAERRRKGK